MDKVLVVGGSGFIGSHLADELTREGYEVHVFDMEASGYLQVGQKMWVGDVRDREAVRAAMKGARYVYHFAGLADIERSALDPWETMSRNVMGTCSVLEACAEENVERVIFGSSMYVYSNGGSFYRVSKQACESLIEEYAATYGLAYTIARIGSVYGSRADQINSIRRLVTEAYEENKLTCRGEPSDIREYIHVSDVVKCCVELLDGKYKNEYVVMTGMETHTLEQVAELIKGVFQGDIKVDFRQRETNFHYKVTPYSFRPVKALKMSPARYCELGQGLLELFYEMDIEKAGQA